MPAPGSKAPAFSLPDTNRTIRTLDEFQGKKTVLAFFPAAFTSVCEKEMCSFRDSMAELNSLNANVIGISVDAPFANGAFAGKNGLEFPVLSDYRREATQAYGVALENFAGMEGYTAAQRSVFIIDGEGVIRYQWIAENPGIEPDYEAIKAELAAIA